MFPAYDLNHAYEDTDVFVSMAKLKNHGVCGVTLSMKNLYGCTPASIYGGDAGVDEPNERPNVTRVAVGHMGNRAPSKCSPGELHPGVSHDPGYRMPRVVSDLVAAMPIHLSIVDGIESIAGANCRVPPTTGGPLNPEC